ncbi:MAG: ABC transporter permease [Acidimicrobiaceae bacterium]|nr:ABC transporter permease [Acidimicrobiaceae bacterium]MDE0494275.1 ABC transporter permease [Acidimicrobiaceae bacterium]MDE0667159.1 ABC transporter permease [Acidimicrobiaceae bacterium]
MGGPLAGFLLRRIAAGAVVLWVVSVLVFSATYVLPGDPAARLLGDQGTPETIAALREKKGIDRPYLEQYSDWVGSFLTGDIKSLTSDVSIAETLTERWANTLTLAAVAFVLTVAIAMPLGVVSGMRAGHAGDHALSTGVLIGLSVPNFVVAGLLIVTFALTWNILPPVSVLSAGMAPLDRPEILVLPALALALPAGAWTSRYVRAAVADARTAPNVEAARLAGLSSTRVICRHLLPATLGTIAQAMANSGAFLVGGTVVVEQIFAYPGLGSMLASAVRVKDVPIVSSTSIVVVAMTIAMFTVADLIGLMMNPRLRRASG